MIDLASETLISLSDVPAYLPKRRSGKHVHVNCGYRWAQRGCKGVRLEVLQCGGTKVTSLEALQRFFDRLTALENGTPTTPQSRTSRQRERAMRQANEELEQAGW